MLFYHFNNFFILYFIMIQYYLYEVNKIQI